MPHCLSEIVMWLPDFGFHAFAGIYYYYFFGEGGGEGGGDRLNGGIWFSGSSLSVQTSGVLKMDGVSGTGI